MRILMRATDRTKTTAPAPPPGFPEALETRRSGPIAAFWWPGQVTPLPLEGIINEGRDDVCLRAGALVGETWVKPISIRFLPFYNISI